jgi:hypothetical protein
MVHTVYYFQASGQQGNWNIYLKDGLKASVFDVIYSCPTNLSKDVITEARCISHSHYKQHSCITLP